MKNATGVGDETTTGMGPERDTDTDTGVAARIAAQTAVRRRPDYVSEVRRLLDSARRVIARTGTASSARVADIVAEAGLSNDAFYRHFPSKDALIAALVEDGAEHLSAGIARKMAEESTPEGKLRCWVDAMLAATQAPTASWTLSLLDNSTNLNTGIPTGKHVASAPFRRLLREPFVALGSTDPDLDADLATHAIVGRVAAHLWARTQPSTEEAEHLHRFCLAIPTLAGPAGDARDR